jgi:outer membrane protein TolC
MTIFYPVRCSVFRGMAFASTTALLLCASIAQAQTLTETIDLALQYQSGLKIGALQVEEQQAAVQQANAQDGFKLSLNGSVGRGRITTPSDVLFPQAGTNNRGMVDLEASYPLYSAGRKEVGISIAQAQLAAAESNVTDAQMRTRFAAIETYSAIVRDQALITLAQNTQTTLDRALNDAQKRLKVGEVTKTDVAQAAAQQAQGIANQTRAKATLIIDQARFRQLTGVEPIHLSNTLTLPHVPSSIEQALSQIKKTPAIETANQQLQAAEHQLTLTKLELRPTVVIESYAMQQQNENFINNRIGNYGVNLKATLPILDGGINTANRQRAQVQVELARERINGLQQNLEQRIRQDYAQLTSSQLQVEALDQTIVAAQLARDTIRREIELGTRTTFDLLSAERTLQDAETQKILNQQDQVVAAYLLLADTGQLTQAQ